ncbi:MAG: trans-sulfuration enzyme family protein [Halobacteriales archaeon]
MDGYRETREVHAGLEDHPYGGVNQPIDTSTTFAYDRPSDLGGAYRYGRMASPSRAELEAVVADLEAAEAAYAFASGMAAIDAVLSLLEPGDEVVAERNLYAETHDLLEDVYPRYGIEVTRVDSRDVGNLAAVAGPDTAMVYLESPTNPRLHVADIAAAADVAEDRDATLAVDNTFASPALQRPLELGADVVVESLTKYVGGHSDVIAGAVATTDADLAERLSRVQYTRGAIPGPLACYLATRGSRTLSRRIRAQCENARAVATHLDEADGVARVHYPGLPDHPNHGVAAEQMADFGAMVSLELAGGVAAAEAFATELSVFTLAESLGGVESLVEVPALMTHRDVPASARREAGIADGLVRLSLGIEAEADLLADLEAAVAAARAA